jgi:phosphatidylinositol glycan class B
MVSAASSRSARHWSNLEPAKQAGKGKGRREWPRYLIFFEPLEGVLGEVLGNSRYRECWRGFNSHWHDDWRRKGDVVVWCLD